MKNTIRKYVLAIIGLVLALAMPQAHEMPKMVSDHGVLISLLVMATTLAIVMRPKRGFSAGGRPVMRCGGVNITETNGNLASAAATNDGIMAIVATGATEGIYTAGTPILITSMVDLASAGITTVGNAYAVKEVQEFYNEAPAGSQLYLMLVTSATTIASMADKTNANGAIKLLNYGQGSIKGIGLIADDKAVHTGGGTITITNGMNADVYTAATNLKALIADFVTAENPLFGLIGGTSYAGVAANLSTMNVGTTNNYVGIVIGDTRNYDATYTGAAVGECLGTFASIPVEQKISWVGNGERSNSAAYLNTVPVTLTNGDPATIAGKGFITFKMYANVAGFFWSGDPTLSATTNDYYMLARRRVINKAHRLVYAYLVNNVDAKVPTVPGTGKIDPGYAKDLETKISGKRGVLTVNMTLLGNCTGSTCFVDPNQNIVSSNTLAVAVTVNVFGYSSTINVNLGLGQ